MKKRVAIVGAGISGLVACKYVLDIGFNPIVFEADDGVGGQWRHTIETTKIQNPKHDFQFTDFSWDSSVKEDNPNNQQVKDYLNSYAQHFSLIPYIKFNSKVIDVDYVGESIEGMNSWELWSGNGTPFGSKGTWHITVEDTKDFSIEVKKVEFLILCIGKYSGFPNIPKFPLGKGPEVFKGKVMHSMDYAALENEIAAELIKNKRVTIVGSGKSALDVATECADKNGATHPCTMIQRTVHWFIPDFNIWGFSVAFLYFNRFGELFVHKPGEHFLLGLVATLFSPLRWGIGKLVETYLKWKLPLKKYGLVPNHSFHHDMYKCTFGILPEFFFDKVKEGSIVIKKSQSFSFCNEGLVINGEAKPLPTDIVIFATGFKGDQKLRRIFKSPIFQNYINVSTNSTVPLYRTKLSLTRWSADWKAATVLYEQAANGFRVARNNEKAKIAYEKASQGQQMLSSPWDAAKHMESAAALAKELSNWREVADFYQKASELYMECGRPQPASDALAKGARALEDTMPEEAIQLYTDACTILEDDDKEQMTFDLYRAVTSVYIKLEKYTDAASCLLKLGLAADKCNATNSQSKAYLSAIIVYLYAHDFKQAEKCYNDCSQIDAFLKSDHNRCASKFLTAYTDGDVDEIKKIAQSSTVSHLDHAIIKLARKLPTGDVTALKAVTREDDEDSLDENDLT